MAGGSLSAGYFTDSLGLGPMVVFGSIVSGLGFILPSLANNLLCFMLVFVSLMSVGFRSGYNNATIPAVNQWFRRKRSLAMSIVSAGSGLGGVALAPIVGLLAFTFGSRDAALFSGIAIIAVVVQLSFLMRRSPEGMGLLPEGERPQYLLDSPRDITQAGGVITTQPVEAVSANAPPRYPAEQGYTAKEAMSTSSFWFLAVSSALRNTVHSGISFLMAPVMVWFLQGEGLSEEDRLPIAAAFIGILPLSTLVFYPIVGLPSDRISKTKSSAVCMVSGALSTVAL
jgi:sugar phosphate permease